MKTKTWGLLTLSLLLLLSSCKDPCKDYDCGNGTCTEVDGEATCVCDAGYEGEQCNTSFNEKFIGTYTLADTCNNGGLVGTETIAISAGTEPNAIIFDQIKGDGPINGIVGTDGISFTISAQTWFNTGTVTGSGSIDLATGVLTLNYFLDQTTGSDFDCKGVGIAN